MNMRKMVLQIGALAERRSNEPWVAEDMGDVGSF